jgi:hypothetical protein
LGKSLLSTPYLLEAEIIHRDVEADNALASLNVGPVTTAAASAAINPAASPEINPAASPAIDPAPSTAIDTATRIGHAAPAAASGDPISPAPVILLPPPPPPRSIIPCLSNLRSKPTPLPLALPRRTELLGVPAPAFRRQWLT